MKNLFLLITTSKPSTQVYRERPTFEHRLVGGRHHVHIDRPRLVADIINNFLAPILSSNVPAAKL